MIDITEPSLVLIIFSKLLFQSNCSYIISGTCYNTIRILIKIAQETSCSNIPQCFKKFPSVKNNFSYLKKQLVDILSREIQLSTCLCEPTQRNLSPFNSSNNFEIPSNNSSINFENPFINSSVNFEKIFNNSSNICEKILLLGQKHLPEHHFQTALSGGSPGRFSPASD